MNKVWRFLCGITAIILAVTLPGCASHHEESDLPELKDEMHPVFPVNGGNIVEIAANGGEHNVPLLMNGDVWGFLACDIVSPFMTKHDNNTITLCDWDEVVAATQSGDYVIGLFEPNSPNDVIMQNKGVVFANPQDNNVGSDYTFLNVNFHITPKEVTITALPNESKKDVVISLVMRGIAPHMNNILLVRQKGS